MAGYQPRWRLTMACVAFQTVVLGVMFFTEFSLLGMILLILAASINVVGGFRSRGRWFR